MEEVFARPEESASFLCSHELVVSPVLSDIRVGTADLNQPSISIHDVVVREGNSGSVFASFQVTLSQPSEDEVLVDFATIDGSATHGTDYVPRTGRLAFAPGQTVQGGLTVEILSDLFDEPDETFAIDLSLPKNATLADGQGIGTIRDDDVSVSMAVTGVTVTEGDPLPAGSGTVDAVFEITLSGPSNRTIRVDYVAQDETAEVGSDYQEAFGYLEIPPGTTWAEVVVRSKERRRSLTLARQMRESFCGCRASWRTRPGGSRRKGWGFTTTFTDGTLTVLDATTAKIPWGIGSEK